MQYRKKKSMKVSIRLQTKDKTASWFRNIHSPYFGYMSLHFSYIVFHILETKSCNAGQMTPCNFKRSQKTNMDLNYVR